MNCSEIAAATPLYRSGELYPAGAAAFAAHVAGCPECARDLREQEQRDDLLRAAILSEAVSTAAIYRRVRERIEAELDGAPRIGHAVGSGTQWRIAALASIAALLLLAFAYRHWYGPSGVYAAAAADHRSEVVDAHWRPWLTDPAAISALAERTGVAPSAVLALAPPGYHLARAKRCALDGRPFLHLVYSNGAQEFSAYLRPRDAGWPARIDERNGAWRALHRRFRRRTPRLRPDAGPHGHDRHRRVSSLRFGFGALCWQRPSLSVGF